MTQRDMFDLEAGLEKAKTGMNRAAFKRSHILRIARRGAFVAALTNGHATADDALKAVVDAGHDPADLGNAAGSIFRNPSWIWNGDLKRSERTSNHGRMIRVWEYAHHGN